MSEAWPIDYLSEYKERLRIIDKCNNDFLIQEAIMVYYASNPVDWINDWCFTYNPRSNNLKLMPFKLFNRQKEFIRFLHECVNDKENGLVEKSRDIGATWLCCAYSVWLWLFVEEAAIGWGSRKELLVDRIGDPNSIFQKIRIILENLPLWMLPERFDFKKHVNYMKIINPQTGATITGEAGDNIGRGGRSTITFKDEAAYYEHPELIEAALGDNTDVQIDISSVHGTNNVFHRRRMAGEEWQVDKVIPSGKTRVFIFDWKDHPNKTQEWYEARRKKAVDEGLLHIFAQEVDRDYSSSIEGIIIPAKWVKAAIDAHLKLDIKCSGLKIAGQDIADEGGDRHAFAYRHGVILQEAVHWGEGDGGDAARRSMQMCSEYGVNELYYDCIGVGAAFKSEANRLRDIGQLPNHLRIMPWNAAQSPIDANKHIIDGDYYTPTNEDFFVNLKIQAWWRLRTRFEKTYKAVTQGIVYKHDQLISIPSSLNNLHIIERELSQPVFKYNNSGKLLVDKKPEGTPSPNLADAIVMCFNPVRTVSVFDVI